MKTKVYVVTGATSGIGNALVKILCKDSIVFAGYRSEEKGKELKCLSENIYPFYVDYAKPETISHEIGHALGLDDIYDNKKVKFNEIPSMNDLVEDNTGELNYYNINLSTIILNLLMNGVEENNSLFIIPLGTIKGEVECRTDNESPIGIIKVGIMNLINNIYTEGIKNGD